MLYKSISSLLKDAYTENAQQDAHRTPRIKRRVDAAMLLMVVVSITMFAFEGSGGELAYIVHAVSVVFDFCFLIDYCLRFYYSGSIYERFSFKKSSENYIFRWYGIVDAIAVFLPLATHVLHLGYASDEFARISRLVRIVRSTRLLRFLRMVRIVREYEGLNTLVGQFFEKVRREIAFALIVITLVVILGTFGLYYAESSVNPEYSSLGHTLYWSFLSILGQSDAASITSVPAQIIAVVVILAGIALLGVVTGSFTTFLVHKIGHEMKGEAAYTHVGHTLICGYNSRLPELIQRLNASKTPTAIVLLFDRGNEVENIGDSQVVWVKGNQRSTEALHRANIKEASSVIVLADDSAPEGKKVEEDDVDARTLMTLNLIQNEFSNTDYTHEEKRKHSVDKSRRRPPLTVELLTPQSIPLAKKIADHVVYADDLVCQFITIDTNSRNATSVYERLIDAADQNIYSIPLTDNLWKPSDPKNVQWIMNIANRNGLYLLGIQIEINLLIEILRGSPEFRSAIERVGLDNYIQSKLAIYNIEYTKLWQGDYEKISRIPEEYIPILNPDERSVLIEALLSRVDKSTVNHRRKIDIVCMSERCPASLV